MLHADKVMLQRQLEVDLLALRQKELDHFSNCLFTLAGPASLLAGFAYVGTTNQVAIPEGTHWALEALYFGLIAGAMLAEIFATTRATLVALMGRALALRGSGPEAMHRAVQMMEVRTAPHRAAQPSRGARTRRWWRVGPFRPCARGARGTGPRPLCPLCAPRCARPCVPVCAQVSFKGAWEGFIGGLRLLLLASVLWVALQADFWGAALGLAVLVLLAMYELTRDIRFIGRAFALPRRELQLGRFSESEIQALRDRRRLSRQLTAGELPGEGARRPSLGEVAKAMGKRAKSVVVGAGGPDEGYLPCVTGSVTGSVAGALAGKLGGGRSVLDAPGARVGGRRAGGAAAEPPQDVSVVFTVPGRGRLRWRAPAHATVGDALAQAQASFRCELHQPADVHGATFAVPEEQRLDALVVLSHEELVVLLSARPLPAGAPPPAPSGAGRGEAGADEPRQRAAAAARV